MRIAARTIGQSPAAREIDAKMLGAPVRRGCAGATPSAIIRASDRIDRRPGGDGCGRRQEAAAEGAQAQFRRDRGEQAEDGGVETFRERHAETGDDPDQACGGPGDHRQQQQRTQRPVPPASAPAAWRRTAARRSAAERSERAPLRRAGNPWRAVTGRDGRRGRQQPARQAIAPSDRRRPGSPAASARSGQAGLGLRCRTGSPPPSTQVASAMRSAAGRRGARAQTMSQRAGDPGRARATGDDDQHRDGSGRAARRQKQERWAAMTRDQPRRGGERSGRASQRSDRASRSAGIGAARGPDRCARVVAAGWIDRVHRGPMSRWTTAQRRFAEPYPRPGTAVGCPNERHPGWINPSRRYCAD